MCSFESLRCIEYEHLLEMVAPFSIPGGKGGSNIYIYIYLSMLWKVRGGLVVTSVNIDLPIFMGVFIRPQQVQIFGHQQYQSYPTGPSISPSRRWMNRSNRRKFEPSKAQRTIKERYRCWNTRVPRCHYFAYLITRILANVDTWIYLNCSLTKKWWTNTFLQFNQPSHLQRIYTRNRDGGPSLLLF